ncbi:NUDIX domain-containing protein [Paraburkholderia aspalathi]|uniref:NUDIX domain-containing protein n=1 Tax=Paraburkholderia aspalathi TaxID=1324617 RepID=UPI003C8909FB
MKERATVLRVRDNRILLVARLRSRWALPGGRIRRGEASHEAALRELEEETTLAATEVTDLFQFSGFNTLHHVFFAEAAYQSIAPGRSVETPPLMVAQIPPPCEAGQRVI